MVVNSLEDMVAPLTSNVCITSHAALNAIGGIICQTVCDVTSIGRLVQCEQGKVGCIYTQRVKQHGCVWVLQGE